MRDLYEQIFTGRTDILLSWLYLLRKSVIVHEILRHPRSLRLPVKPDSPCAVMDMISSYNDIDRGMHLDSADLSAGEIVPVIDMMDLVILYHTEYAAKVTHDPSLPAVVDIAVLYKMRADILFIPAFRLRFTYAVALRLSAILIFCLKPFIIIIGLQIFAERYPRAFGIRNLTVLDDPTLAPVRSDHTFLISSRRSPLRCSFTYPKAGKCYMTDSLFLRIETVLTHIDLYILFIRI